MNIIQIIDAFQSALTAGCLLSFSALFWIYKGEIESGTREILAKILASVAAIEILMTLIRAFFW